MRRTIGLLAGVFVTAGCQSLPTKPPAGKPKEAVPTVAAQAPDGPSAARNRTPVVGRGVRQASGFDGGSGVVQAGGVMPAEPVDPEAAFLAAQAAQAAHYRELGRQVFDLKMKLQELTAKVDRPIPVAAPPADDEETALRNTVLVEMGRQVVDLKQKVQEASSKAEAVAERGDEAARSEARVLRQRLTTLQVEVAALKATLKATPRPADAEVAPSPRVVLPTAASPAAGRSVPVPRLGGAVEAAAAPPAPILPPIPVAPGVGKPRPGPTGIAWVE